MRYIDKQILPGTNNSLQNHNMVIIKIHDCRRQNYVSFLDNYLWKTRKKMHKTSGYSRNPKRHGDDILQAHFRVSKSLNNSDYTFSDQKFTHIWLTLSINANPVKDWKIQLDI